MAGTSDRKADHWGRGSWLQVAVDFDPGSGCQPGRLLGLPEDAFHLLFLGRKTEYKGLDTCLEAAASLRPRRPKLYLIAAGPDTEYSQRLLGRYAGADGLIVKGHLRGRKVGAVIGMRLPDSAVDG